MNTKTIGYIGLALITLGMGYAVFTTPIPPTPSNALPPFITLSGTTTCLPLSNTSGEETQECTLGMKAEDGNYYALDFGPNAMEVGQFPRDTHFTAEGTIFPKEKLSSAQWAKYTMKGVFIVSTLIDPQPTSQPSAKLNIDAVCEGTLAYSTFPDAKTADKFVADCKDGKYPEVIEEYRARMNLGDGAAI